MLLTNIIKNEFLPNASESDNNIGKFIKNGKIVSLFEGFDSEDLYVQNLKTQPKDWYYRTHPVEYTLNSQGYRTKEFNNIDWSESIVMFGCSHVFGIGVTDKHTIPYFLEQLSGRPVINMGIGGSSINTTLYNGTVLHDSKYPNPKVVIPFWTYLNRHSIDYKTKVDHYGDWNFDESPLKICKYHVITQNLLNIKLFRNLWKDKVVYSEYMIIDGVASQIDLINKLDNNISCYPFSEVLGSARDLSHAGFKENLMMAEKIYATIRHLL